MLYNKYNHTDSVTYWKKYRSCFIFLRRKNTTRTAPIRLHPSHSPTFSPKVISPPSIIVLISTTLKLLVWSFLSCSRQIVFPDCQIPTCNAWLKQFTDHFSQTSWSRLKTLWQIDRWRPGRRSFCMSHEISGGIASLMRFSRRLMLRKWTLKWFVKHTDKQSFALRENLKSLT